VQTKLDIYFLLLLVGHLYSASALWEVY